MKKKYNSPETVLMQVSLHQMIAASTFDATSETQNITVSDEEADLFTSRRQSNVWDEEDEDNTY